MWVKQLIYTAWQLSRVNHRDAEMDEVQRAGSGLHHHVSVKPAVMLTHRTNTVWGASLVLWFFNLLKFHFAQKLFNIQSARRPTKTKVRSLLVLQCLVTFEPSDLEVPAPRLPHELGHRQPVYVSRSWAAIITCYLTEVQGPHVWTMRYVLMLCFSRCYESVCRIWW